tara:strand:- start:917 stop:2830 length:1914 start_codon:yes stop_codon:yes gene_type:complete
MNNPPIIKPKNSILRMLQSPIGMIGPGAAGVTGLMALDETFRNDKRKNNIALGTAKAKGLSNPFIPEDPILSPDSIQKDLNALTSDLKNVKSQKPKKEELVNEKEIKEFDDVDNFKSWIKENTATDAETGDIFFVQPLTGEKVPIEGNPETNVLLYEVFKEQTGREGEALEAIKTMNIEELQRTPNVQQTVERETNQFDDKFTKDLQKIRKDIGVPRSSGFFGRNEEQDMRDRIQELELQAARGMASPRDGSFLGEEARRNAAVMATRAGQLQSQLPEADKKDFYSYRRKDSSVLGFGDKGQNNFTLTPTPLSEREAYELTKDGNYEIAPAELATEVRGDPADQEQEFLRKAILAGRIPMPGGEEQAISTPTERLEERISIPEETVLQPENLKFKRFTNSTVPGLYSRGTKDPLKYQLEVYEDESGNIQYKPGPGLDTVLQDIYKASEYSQRSKEEIEAIKQFIGPSSVGPVAAVTDFAERIGLSVSGLGDTIDDTDFGKLRKWAQNFTAKNITTILGESNRTISDADRQRADQIVNINNNWTSIPKVRNALTELIKIFEEPGRNSEAAYQALMNQAESMGYLDQMLDTERRLYNKRVRGGSGSYAPISSRIFLDEDQAISEDNFNDDFDFEIDLTS